MPSDSELDSLLQETADDGRTNSHLDRQTSEALASLEKSLQDEKDGRREDRFLFIALSVALVDAFLFKEMSGWTGPLVIGLIQFCVLLVLARRCGIDEVRDLVDRLAAWTKMRS